MVRKALIAAGLLAALGAVGVLVLLRNVDALVASAIEDVGGRATQAPVSVGSVNLRVTEGAGTIEGLVVGNPQGFSTPHAFAFGTIHFELDPEALTRAPVVVRKVTIDGCEVGYEWSTSGSNVARIEENVATFVTDLTGGGAAEQDGATKIVIERLVIEGGRIDVSATFLGGRQVGAPLRRIELTNLGAEEGGATPGEIAAVVLGALTGSVLETVAGLGIDGLGDVRRRGREVLDAAGRALKGLIGK